MNLKERTNNHVADSIGEEVKSKGTLRKVVSDEFKCLLDDKDRCLIDKQVHRLESINVEKITEFIKREISFDKMVKNCGIYETSPIARYENEYTITIGVAYEDNMDFEERVNDSNNENCKEHYYYNIFIDEEYVDIENSIAYKNDLIPVLTVEEIIREIKKLVDKGCAAWIFDKSA